MIGVSNFLQQDIESLLETANVKPMVNQVLCHISNTPLSLIDYCQSRGIAVSYLIYMNGMSGGQFGFQSANAFVFFVIVVIISFLQMKFLGKKEEQL